MFGRSGNFELIVFGILMILLLQFARDGLWPWIARLIPQRTPPPVPPAEPLPARDRAPRDGALLDVQKARKQFGGLVAVNDLSFEIRPGEILGPDRSQRRGQEHDVQPHLRRGGADVRRHPISRRVDRRQRPPTRSRGAASAARSST